MSQVTGIIQARLSSTRLPGKVLKAIAGQPMLVHVVERLRTAETVDEVVVATTTDGDDDSIVMVCRDRGIACFRGHPTDVLDRYYRTALEYQAEVVVRVTADCPLLDPGLVDQAVRALLESEPRLDFVANRLPYERTYPIGLDVEACWFDGLAQAWREAQAAHQREHVMPFFYEGANRFATRLLHAEADYGAMRWTVDTPEDLEFVRAVFAAFAPRTEFGWRELLDLVQRQPELAAINAHVRHKKLHEQ